MFCNTISLTLSLLTLSLLSLFPLRRSVHSSLLEAQETLAGGHASQ